MYINNVVVVGNLTSDPRMSEGDGKVVNFRMAVNRYRKPQQESEEAGAQALLSTPVKERTEFIDVECWGSQADHIDSSLHRGDRAIVAGQLKYDQWNDEDGNMKSRIRIRAQAVGASLEFQDVSRPAGA